ncbi:MAG: sulfotransferase domain-containing protein [Chloroflexota bacterium]
MTDPFLEKAQQLFNEGRYDEVIWAWGADTSRSAEFKAQAFVNYRPGKHDVIVPTYPKTGTTWMLQMAHQIAFLGAGDFEHQYDVMPWPDKLIPLPDNIALDDMSVAEGSPTGLRVIKSHLEAEFIPYTADAKYISVIRDPKDMLVSMVHFENGFNKMLFGDIVPVASWVEAFQGEKFLYQPWAEFIDSWWSLGKHDNVLVVTYEEMKTEGVGMIERVAAFLGVALTAVQLDKVAERTSFAYMKANEHLFAQPAWEEGYVPLMRSGQSGIAKELLSLEQQQQIDAFCLRELARIGSDFPYRDKFKVSI